MGSLLLGPADRGPSVGKSARGRKAAVALHDGDAEVW